MRQSQLEGDGGAPLRQGHGSREATQRVSWQPLGDTRMDVGASAATLGVARAGRRSAVHFGFWKVRRASIGMFTRTRSRRRSTRQPPSIAVIGCPLALNAMAVGRPVGVGRPDEAAGGNAHGGPSGRLHRTSSPSARRASS
eukprot:scaffold3031_cov28-Tisochrysis_lutea.AAC.6